MARPICEFAICKPHSYEGHFERRDWLMLIDLRHAHKRTAPSIVCEGDWGERDLLPFIEWVYDYVIRVYVTVLCCLRVWSVRLRT